MITEADTAAAASGATVEYVLTVKKEDETDAGGAESLKILAKEKGKAEDLYYLDIALEKTLVDASKKVTVNSIAGADQILEIAFPIPHGLSDRKNIVVFRYHEESAAALDKFLSRQQLPTTEGFYVDTAMGYVFVYARSFSTYALACDKLSGGFPEGARCTLSYVSNGGTAYPDEQVACGTTVRLEKTPWREGYTFLGWYSDRELTRPVTELVMNGSRTVYALSLIHIYTMAAAGVTGVLAKGRGWLAVLPEAFSCDYYDFIQGDVQMVNAYMGEYMAQYSWAEFVVAYLDRH